MLECKIQKGLEELFVNFCNDSLTNLQLKSDENNLKEENDSH